MVPAEMWQDVGQSRSNCKDNLVLDSSPLSSRTEMRIQLSFLGEDSKEPAATKTCDAAQFSSDWVTNA